MADSASNRLELQADPTAVAQARAWLGTCLEGWSADGVTTVQLLASELVTNAILHTDASVAVSLTRAGSRATVEVADPSPSNLVVKTYGREASTGRGLRLVEAFADSWGVRRSDTYKAVWFRVVDGGVSTTPGMSPAGRSDGRNANAGSLPEGPGLDDAPGASDAPEVAVHLIGLPIETYLAAEEHHDALMREFALLPRLGDDRFGVAVSPRLVELATVLGRQFGVGNEHRRAQVEEARRAGRTTVDVVLSIRSDASEEVWTVADQLDEVDAYCARAELLTLPSSPAVQDFRHWYAAEVVRQLSGGAPSPWEVDTSAVIGDAGRR